MPGNPAASPTASSVSHGPIVNGMKAPLALLGIRDFNPKLKKAADRPEDLRTPDGEPIPTNTVSELRRDLERRRLVMLQIRQVETARLERLRQAPKTNQSQHKAALAFRWACSRHADCRESLIYGGSCMSAARNPLPQSVDGRNGCVCCGPKPRS
jgi:hypothetical protein